MRRVMPFLPFALMLGCVNAPAQQGTQQAGGVTVYRRFDQLTIRDTGSGPALELPDDRDREWRGAVRLAQENAPAGKDFDRDWITLSCQPRAG